MGDELMAFAQKKMNLERQYEEMIMKNMGTQVHWNSEKWRIGQLKESIKAIKIDISGASKSISKKLDLKRECISLYHKYRNIDEAPPSSVPREAIPSFTESELLATLETSAAQKAAPHFEQKATKPNEASRYREQLEKTIQILKKEDLKRTAKRIQGGDKIIKEGVILTR